MHVSNYTKSLVGKNSRRVVKRIPKVIKVVFRKSDFMLRVRKHDMYRKSCRVIMKRWGKFEVKDSLEGKDDNNYHSTTQSM